MTKKPHPIVATLITVVLLVGITGAITVLTNQTQENDALPSPSVSQPIDTSQATNPGGYADGTYSAVGNYSTPGGIDSIGLTVTLENGIVIGTELDQHATSGNSAQFQGQFASGYEPLIIGKDIDEVQLSRVAGSSLTSNGFNDALEKIKEEARAGS